MYNDYYAFRAEPFSATPDPQFFFPNRIYQEAFATLQYGVLAKRGFVVVTGEVGTGKTTLLRKLLHTLGPTVHSVFIFNTQVTFTELLRLVLDELALPRQGEDKLSMIAALNQYLIERLEAGHIVALLVDEAQNLSDEVLEGLRLLSNLETDTEKLLQIVLMGQPELETKLAQPKMRQLKQRVTLHSRLAPLAAREVAGYIQFRLDAVGCPTNNLFSSAVVEEIAGYSKGIPRLINIICDNALLLGFADGKKEISAEMIREVAADLRLHEPGEPAPSRPRPSPLRTDVVGERKDLSWLNDARDVPDERWVATMDSPSFSTEPVNVPARPRRKLRWAGLGLTWALIAIGVAAVVAALDLNQTGEYLSRRANRSENAGRAAPDVVAAPDETPHVGSPADAQTAKLSEGPEHSGAAAPAGREADRSARSRAAENSGAGRERLEIPKAAEPENQRKRLEAEIRAALQNRAISGVAVSVVDGTAYLDGRVASLRQKAMAERAARSVADVKRVRNRLNVAPSRLNANEWRDDWRSWRDASVYRD